MILDRHVRLALLVGPVILYTVCQLPPPAGAVFSVKFTAVSTGLLGTFILALLLVSGGRGNRRSIFSSILLAVSVTCAIFAGSANIPQPTALAVILVVGEMGFATASTVLRYFRPGTPLLERVMLVAWGTLLPVGLATATGLELKGEHMLALLAVTVCAVVQWFLQPRELHELTPLAPAS